MLLSRPPRQAVSVGPARRMATNSRQGGRPQGNARPAAQQQGGAPMRGKPGARGPAMPGRKAVGGAPMKKAAAGAAASAVANKARGKFLREEEDDDDLMMDEDEDLDEFDVDGLPEGTSPVRGAALDEFEEDRLREQEEDKAEVEEEDPELARLAPEELERARRQEASYSFDAMKELGADATELKQLRNIVRGVETDEERMRDQEAEKAAQENPPFFDSKDSPAHVARDRHVVFEAMYRGWLKSTRGVEEAARVGMDPRADNKLQLDFNAMINAGKFTQEELTKWADEHFNEYARDVATPALDAAVDALTSTPKTTKIERSFATLEEARPFGPEVLALGNKFVPVTNYVRIKQQEFDAFFPEGVAGTLDKEWLMMNNRRSILVREPAIEIAEALEKQRADRFRSGPPAHFIRGLPGVGKSCVLSSVVYWARKNGWLVVWIPSGFNFVNDGNLQRSRREPLHFDQPEVAMPFLEKFGKGNAHIIGQLPLRTSFTIGVPNVVFSSEGKTMLDLVNFAKDSFDYATDAAFYLRHELNLVTEFPVLLAIDDYNSFHDHAVNLYDPDFQKLNPPLISPEKLVLASLFRSWENHGLANGTMVVSMSNTRPRNTKAFDARFPKLPSVFTVDRYSRDEFFTVVANYEQNGYIHTPATSETYRYVYHMCAGRGSEIYKMLALY